MSEAYLEGMKTIYGCITRNRISKSEAYLEGMKTWDTDLRDVYDQRSPKPTSKE